MGKKIIFCRLSLDVLLMYSESFKGYFVRLCSTSGMTWNLIHDLTNPRSNKSASFVLLVIKIQVKTSHASSLRKKKTEYIFLNTFELWLKEIVAWSSSWSPAVFNFMNYANINSVSLTTEIEKRNYFKIPYILHYRLYSKCLIQMSTSKLILECLMNR